MNDFPPCPTPPAPVVECCIAAIPNTSTWAVVCPGADAVPFGPAVVPTLTDLGLALLAVSVVAVALRRLR